MNHYPSWTSLTSLQISINLNNWGTEQKVKLSDHHFTSFQFYGGWKATFSLTAKDPRKLVIAYISFLGWPIQTSLIWSKTVPKKTCYKTWQEKLKEAEQDEAILTFRRYVIRLVCKVSSSVNSQRKWPKKAGEKIRKDRFNWRKSYKNNTAGKPWELKKQEQEDGEVGNVKRICSEELVKELRLRSKKISRGNGI
jgi:hypothetical protein